MTGLFRSVITARVHGSQVHPTAIRELDLDLVAPLALMVGSMEGLVDSSHEVCQYKDGAWLACFGFMHVGAQAIGAPSVSRHRCRWRNTERRMLSYTSACHHLAR